MGNGILDDAKKHNLPMFQDFLQIMVNSLLNWVCNSVDVHV